MVAGGAGVVTVGESAGVSGEAAVGSTVTGATLGGAGGSVGLTSRFELLIAMNVLVIATATTAGQVTFCFQTLGGFASTSEGLAGRIVPLVTPGDAAGTVERAAAAGAFATGAAVTGVVVTGVRGTFVGFVGAAGFGVVTGFVATGVAEVDVACGRTGAGVVACNASCSPLGVWTAIS